MPFKEVSIRTILSCRKNSEFYAGMGIYKREFGTYGLLSPVSGKRKCRNLCETGNRAWVLQLSGHAAVVIELGASGCLKEKQKNILGFL